MKKIRGWHDAVFRLGQETHQIPFVSLKRTRWASRSKSRSGSQNVSSLALYRRRIPNRVFTSKWFITLKCTIEKYPHNAQVIAEWHETTYDEKARSNCCCYWQMVLA